MKQEEIIEGNTMTLAPGTKVRIKSWAELVEKYGVDAKGNIKSPKLSILKGGSMETQCGTRQTILEVHEKGVYKIGLYWYPPESLDILPTDEALTGEGKGQTDVYLSHVLNDYLGEHFNYNESFTPSELIAAIKTAIAKDNEAHRLFCKEVVRKKIEGKGVEGLEFNK